MVSEEEVMEVLEKIVDPETKVDIVNMGFVYNIEVDGGKVDIEMTLTTPGCPMQKVFVSKVKESVGSMDDVEDVEVSLVFEPPWSPEMMSQSAKKKLGWNKI